MTSTSRSMQILHNCLSRKVSFSLWSLSKSVQKEWILLDPQEMQVGVKKRQKNGWGGGGGGASRKHDRINWWEGTETITCTICQVTWYINSKTTTKEIILSYLHTNMSCTLSLSTSPPNSIQTHTHAYTRISTQYTHLQIVVAHWCPYALLIWLSQHLQGPLLSSKAFQPSQQHPHLHSQQH